MCPCLWRGKTWLCVRTQEESERSWVVIRLPVNQQCSAAVTEQPSAAGQEGGME